MANTSYLDLKPESKWEEEIFGCLHPIIPDCMFGTVMAMPFTNMFNIG